MIATVTTAARVYIPMHPRTGESLIYFEDIAAMRSESFAKRAKAMSPDMIEEQLLSQIHIVSRIASAKMHRVRWAFWLSVPSLVLGLILLAWGQRSALNMQYIAAYALHLTASNALLLAKADEER